MLSYFTGGSSGSSEKDKTESYDKGCQDPEEATALEATRKAVDDQNKIRKVNTTSKTEFFNDPAVKNNYKSTPDGAKILKDGGTPIQEAKRLEWDHTHNDVEAYKDIAGKKHLGSIDPQTKQLYKGPVVGRKTRKN